MRIPFIGRPIIPRGRPKSWVVAMGAGWSGFIVGAPLNMYALLCEDAALLALSWSIGIITWVIFGVMSNFCLYRNAKGAYKNLQWTNWRNQIW